MTHAAPTRAAIVATAQEAIARGSRSFAAASRLFGRQNRERAWLLYAWCRACDDIADGQDHGHGMTGVSDGPARLAEISAKTEAALAGAVIGDPAFDALRLFAAEVKLPPALPRDLIAGFALDARDWRPQTEHDLYQYCYHVAGVVGCMMALAMGVAPDDDATLDRACDLGLAFQLANIARDVGEDARAGRCYLPQDWLDEADIPADDLLAPQYRDALGRLGARLAERAAAYEASARFGTPGLVISVGLGGAGGGGYLWGDCAGSGGARAAGMGQKGGDIGHGEDRHDGPRLGASAAAAVALSGAAARPELMDEAARGAVMNWPGDGPPIGP